MAINQNPAYGLQTLDFEKLIDLSENTNLKDSATVKLGNDGFEAKSLRLKEKLFGVSQSTRQETQTNIQQIRESLAQRLGQRASDTLYNTFLKNAEKKGSLTAGTLRDMVKSIAKHDYSNKVLSNIQNRMQGEGTIRTKSGFTLLSQDVKDALRAGGFNEELLRRALNSTQYCLTQGAYGPAGIADMNRQITSASNTLARLEGALRQGGVGATELAEHLSELRTELSERKALLLEQQQTNPFSGKNVQPMVTAVYSAAIRTLEHVIAGEAAGPTKERLLEAKGNFSKNWIDQMAELKQLGDRELSKDQIDSIGKLPSKIQNTLQEIVGDRLDQKTLASNFKNEFSKSLNTATWGTLRREIPMANKAGIGGTQSTVTVVSTMKPANQIGSIGESLKAQGLNGVNSGDTKNHHAMNLWQTQFSVKNANGTEKVLFQGVRHGVLDAYGIKDKAEHKAANINRAKEAYTAALESNPKLLEQARNARPGEVIDLPIVSTSLLTPTIVAYEGSKYVNQTQAWKDACNQDGTVNLRVSDGQGGFKEVKVRPQVLPFNFAVDMTGQSFGGGSWSTNGVGTNNSEGLKKLFGGNYMKNGTLAPESMVGKFLQKLEQEGGADNAALRDKVVLLMNQINSMWNDKAYKTYGSDPYAFPARIALLAHLIGATPCFNCKSGKDRTGQLDVSIKTLAYQLETGQLQDDYKARPADHRQQMERIAMNSGQHELQQLNTGLAGNKITSGGGSPKGIHNEFSAEGLKYYGGLGKQVHS